MDQTQVSHYQCTRPPRTVITVTFTPPRRKHVLMDNESYYNQPMKFEEGNVVTGVCLSTGRRGGIPGLMSLLGVGMPGHRSLLRADMSGGGHPCTHPPGMDQRGVPTPWYWHLVAVTTCTVNKQAARVLLECILVFLLLGDDLTRIYQHLISFTTEFLSVFFWLQSRQIVLFLW